MALCNSFRAAAAKRIPASPAPPKVDSASLLPPPRFKHIVPRTNVSSSTVLSDELHMPEEPLAHYQTRVASHPRSRSSAFGRGLKNGCRDMRTRLLEQQGLATGRPGVKALQRYLSVLPTKFDIESDSIEVSPTASAPSPSAILGAPLVLTQAAVSLRPMTLGDVVLETYVVHPALPEPILPKEKKSMKVTVGRAQDLGRRGEQQDRYSIDTDFKLVESDGQTVEDGVPRTLVTVCDGHDKTGAEAAQTACTSLASHLARSYPMQLFNAAEDISPAEAQAQTGRVGEAIKAATLATDQDVLQGLGGRPGGTTMVMMLIVGTYIWFANTGDSRVVLSRGGVAERMSVDHKPEDDAEAASIFKKGGEVMQQRGCPARVYVREGARFEGGLAMTRALGDANLKSVITAEPNVSHVMASPSPSPADEGEGAGEASPSFAILASDGLWEKLSDQQAVDVVARKLQVQWAMGSSMGRAAERAAAALLEAAGASREQHGYGGKVSWGSTGLLDNTTAVVVVMSWE